MSTYANMPEINGVPPDIGVFHCFQRLAPVLLEFASRHSLFVRKYYHNQPMWTFHFLHPKGGFGMVQIHAAPLSAQSFKAAVASHWWVDDEEKCQRSSLATRPVSIEDTRPEALLALLGEDAGRSSCRDPSGLIAYFGNIPTRAGQGG